MLAEDIPQVEDTGETEEITAMVRALRMADHFTSLAVEIASRLMSSGAIERSTGLPTELALALEARRSTREARLLAEAAATLCAMPLTAAAFGRGALSWDEVRLITAAVRPIRVEQRAQIDALVAAQLEAGTHSEALIAAVYDEVAAVRPELLAAREQRGIERSFISIQPRLDGEGGSLLAVADGTSFATMLEAIERASPLATPEDETTSRARQRFDGLLSICEASLAGGHSGRRPKPRLLAVVDVKDLQTDAGTQAARILWRAFGRPGRLSTLGTDVLGCDAEVVPVIFEGARPIAVGDATSEVPAKIRTALEARDQGCRFPGCGAPVAWCDAHHTFGRGRGHRIEQLVLLCRRCHQRVHRRRWRIIAKPDGSITFRYRGRDYRSAPCVTARE